MIWPKAIAASRIFEGPDAVSGPETAFYSSRFGEEQDNKWQLCTLPQ